MAVETGNYIANLDPNAPVDSEPLGESNEHHQLIKRVLDTTFQGSVGDLYDDVSGPVLVGPVALNRQPADIANIAAEIGLDLDNVSNPSIIDDLTANTVRSDAPQTIGQDWDFTGSVGFTGATSLPAGATVGGQNVASVDDIPTYYEASKLLITSIGDGGPYSTTAADLGRKIVFTGASARTITVTGGVNDDTMLITNAAGADNVVLSVTGAANEDFLGATGLTKTVTITGRYKTIGLHKVNGAWHLTGDYD